MGIETSLIDPPKPVMARLARVEVLAADEVSVVHVMITPCGVAFCWVTIASRAGAMIIASTGSTNDWLISAGILGLICFARRFCQIIHFAVPDAVCA